MVSGSDIGNDEIKSVIHVGRQASAKGGIMRMFLDFEMLRRECDNIVLAPSTFSSMAYMTAQTRSTGTQVNTCTCTCTCTCTRGTPARAPSREFARRCEPHASGCLLVAIDF